MFLVDDLINKALDAIKDEIVNQRDVSRETIAHARKSMRRLAASLSETVEYLEGGLHSLRRVGDNKKMFTQALTNLIDQENLQINCSEAGVCEDLRLAQDELKELSRKMRLPKNQKAIEDLIFQIDGYEREFVRAVREFLGASRKYDLAFIQTKKDLEPQIVLVELADKMEELKSIVRKIDDVMDNLRQNAI
ncbi:MAG: hypothetical protein HY781_07740 [Chloroflexi bacterium]|nr:hypothetical protein [Chloroflexota bacterium]